MIKIEQLYYLTLVARYNSINKAAENLYLTSSAVSASMKQLEKECGYAILERTYRGVRLTEKGKHVLKVAEQILRLCDDLIQKEEAPLPEARKTVLLVPTMVNKFFLKKLIGGSSKVLWYFRLVEVHKELEEICQALSDNTIALLMVDQDELQRLKELQNQKGIICTLLYQSKMYPVSSKHTKYIPPECTKISQKDFERLPQIVMGNSRKKTAHKNIVLQTENVDVYAEAIINDYGVGMLAKFASELFVVDYQDFKIYAPFDDMMYIVILSNHNGVERGELLKQLIQ